MTRVHLVAALLLATATAARAAPDHNQSRVAAPTPDRVVQISVAPDRQARIQALYTEAHQSYRLGDLDNAARAFADLAAAAPGSFLEIDALRMQALIKLGRGQTVEAALDDYRQALAVLDAMPNPEPLDAETALTSFGNTMGLLAESTGDFDAAIDISSRMLNLSYLHEASREQALLRLGRAELARNNNDVAKLHFQRYLDEHPRSGWNNGIRIEVLRSIEVADGMQWTGGTPREIRFCTTILADPAFRRDEARYDLGVHLGTCLLATGRDPEVEPLINTLLADIAHDLQAAEEADNSERRAWLKEHAEGALRHTLIFALVATNRHDDALAQIRILSSSPDYGGYANPTPERFGILPTPE